MKKNKEKWCPTQNGTYTAYVPEFLYDGEWKRIPTVEKLDGVGFPCEFGGINKTISLYGCAQAKALAWMYFADIESLPPILNGKTRIIPEIRIQGYEVHYEIKAKKIEVEKL